MDDQPRSTSILDLTSNIVATYVANNEIKASAIPSLIGAVYGSLAGAGVTARLGPDPDSRTATPAQIRKSIRPDALTSFEDGKPYRTLKRHLSRRGLTLEAYRVKWGLPADYPSVAPDYAAKRSAIAISNWFGRRDATSAGQGRKVAK